MNRRALVAFTGIMLLVGGFVMMRGRAGTVDALPREHRTIELQVGDRSRQCLLYVPSKYDPAKAVPLVIMLHGMGGTGTQAMNETAWSAKAESETFIVAYPEATRADERKPASLTRNPQAWNDGSGRFHAAEQKVDDVAFLDALITRLSKDYRVDPKRIYVAGFSNGASMAFRAGAELSGRIAAIAPDAGVCWNETLKLKNGVSVCYITGTTDPLNPLDGGFPKLALGGKDQGGRKKPPVQEFIDKWVTANACQKKPEHDETKNGVRQRTYRQGRDGAVVDFFAVEGLGHHWAGGKSLSPELLVGKNTSKLNATNTAWAFFLAHPKP